MRYFLYALIAASAVVAAAAPSPSTTLSRSQYDLAEAVFRDCISHSDQQTVYHLSSGTNESVLPADFIARFGRQSPLIRSIPDGTTVLSNRWITDKITGRPAARLSILEIHDGGSSADVELYYKSSATVIYSRYFLVREADKWRVRDMKTELIGCK